VLMRFDPFRELDRLTQGWSFRPATLAMDAYRRGDQFVVHFDLPGVDPSTIELTIEQNVLDLKAARSWDDGDDADLVLGERPQGTFSRQLFLGESLDADGIQASYDNGVLTVTVPVAEAARSRKVAVGAGSAGGQKAIETTSQAA